MRTRSTLAVLVASAFLLSAACSSKSELKGDAAITACTPGPDDGQPVAEGQITNTSSKSSNFTIRVGFTDSSGNKVSEGGDVVTDVEPSSSSPWRVTGITSMKGPVTCEVLDVTRNVNPGG